MDALSTLRYLPRRSVLCVLFSLMMFLACAFYTLFLDSKRSTLSTFKYVDTIDYDGDTYSEASAKRIFGGNRYYLREVSNLKPMNILEASSSDNASSSRMTLPGGQPNVTSFGKRKNTKSVQVTTKYMYLANSTSSPVAHRLTSSALNNKITTVMPSYDTCRTSMEESKLILLWTPFFDYWNYLPKEHFSQCTRCKNCRVTRDRSKLIESDAVIFHARDMSVIDMPPVRFPHQKWIFYCLESPPYSDFPGLQHMQNMFNWTMTYRSDSDIVAAYGYTYKVRPPRKLDLESLEWAWSNKSRSVVWMSSHCPTHGGRDLFAEALRKYIDIDIYGTCGTSICPPGETDKCLREFSQKYKFFLAFENSVCKDYITEKFYRTLQYNVIPVVFGGADYDKFAPPGSYIDALSFKSPKHLAFFLTGVGKNFKLYSSFFKWRKNYAVNLNSKKECQLCSMLHRRDLKPSSYRDLREWWIKGSNCKVWQQ